MGMSGLSLLGSPRAGAATQLSVSASHKRSRIVIAGGGTGGMIAAARIRRAAPNAQVILIAPNATHLYQSGQVYVAAGLHTQYDNERQTSDLLPDGATWLQEKVTAFDPEHNMLLAEKSGKILYDILIVAMGVEYDFERIEGLESSMIGKQGIASAYLNDTVRGTAKGGDLTHWWLKEIYSKASRSSLDVLFTQPDTPIKGVGSALDMLFLSDDFLKGNGGKKVRDVHQNVRFTYAAPTASLFPSKVFENALHDVVSGYKNIDTALGHTLTSINAEKKIATFSVADQKVQKPYDFIHITPPMHPPKVFRDSPLAYHEGEFKGWMAADRKTMRHRAYQNVFGIGDVLGIPLGKSGGSAQQQGIILQDNIAAALEGKPLPAQYDGYTVAPIKTEFGKIMLAEFNEQGPAPTFWLDPRKSRWLWWGMDLHLMRQAYFTLLMRGMM